MRHAADRYSKGQLSSEATCSKLSIHSASAFFCSANADPSVSSAVLALSTVAFNSVRILAATWPTSFLKDSCSAFFCSRPASPSEAES